jgi:predicted acyltransferase
MKSESGDRISSIDVFRGLTIIVMVVVNYISGIRCIPDSLKHAPDIGLTITDLVAPAFIFAIGLTFKLSFDRRSALFGIKKAYSHFFLRYLSIIGIGALFTSGAAIVDVQEASGAWGVLQAIGAAGLVTLIFIRLNTIWRFIIGITILVGYQLMLDNFWLAQVLSAAQGGLQAVPSWGALLLLSTALADLYHHSKGSKYIFPTTSVAVLLLGILSSFWFVLSKHRVSFSYVLISIGISACVFFILDVLLRHTKLKLSVCRWWGQNPLLLYILHMLFLGVTYLPGNEIWYADATVWSAILQTAVFFSILCCIAWLLHHKRIVLKL